VNEYLPHVADSTETDSMKRLPAKRTNAANSCCYRPACLPWPPAGTTSQSPSHL